MCAPILTAYDPFSLHPRLLLAATMATTEMAATDEAQITPGRFRTKKLVIL